MFPGSLHELKKTEEERRKKNRKNGQLARIFRTDYRGQHFTEGRDAAKWC